MFMIDCKTSVCVQCVDLIIGCVVKKGFEYDGLKVALGSFPVASTESALDFKPKPNSRHWFSTQVVAIKLVLS